MKSKKERGIGGLLTFIIITVVAVFVGFIMVSVKTNFSFVDMKDDKVTRTDFKLSEPTESDFGKYNVKVSDDYLSEQCYYKNCKEYEHLGLDIQTKIAKGDIKIAKKECYDIAKENGIVVMNFYNSSECGDILTVPYGIQSIGYNVDSGNQIKEIYLPEGLVGVTSGFLKEDLISSVILPPTVKIYDDLTFKESQVVNVKAVDDIQKLTIPSEYLIDEDVHEFNLEKY